MGSLNAKRMLMAATCGALWLAGCGGGEGTPRPENAGGAGGTTGGTGGTTGGTGGTNASGSGGTGGSAAGSAGMAVDECPTRMPRTGGVINDVEAVGTVDAERRRFPSDDGGWFIYHANPSDMQCTDSCTTTPPRDGSGEFTLSPTMPERDGSTNALHVVGSGFPSTAYGGGIGMYLDCASLDAAITGVSFWYRSDVPLTFGVSTGLPSADHTAAVPAAEEWTQMEISFSSLSPSNVDRAVFGAMFWRISVPPGTTADWGFDVWLDDVSWIGGS